jgi:hypothetical protein
MLLREAKEVVNGAARTTHDETPTARHPRIVFSDPAQMKGQ